MTKKIAKQSAASDLCEKIGIKSEDSSANSSISDTSLSSSMVDLNINTLERTPVTILQEFCAKNKLNAPCYEELSCPSTPLNKVFKCKAAVAYQGEFKDATGTGSSKKSAKHSAARCLLDLLGIKFDWTPEVDQDTVSILKCMCESRNYSTPVYEDVQVSGPSHCPEFTLRCSVAELVCEAKAPSKKLAKQKVAKEVIRFIEESPESELEKLQVVLKLPEFYIEEDAFENLSVNTTYRQYKSSSNKKPIKLDLSDRHQFFVSHLEAGALEKARREFISRKHKTLQAKVEKTLETAGIGFTVKQVSSMCKPMLAFELDSDLYDCYIVAFEDEFWSQIADYFIVMLNIPISLSDTLETLTVS